MNTVRDCPNHPNCTVITSDGWPDQQGSWESHAASDIDPAVRLNDKYPEALDRRQGKSGTLRRRPPTAAEQARLDGGPS